jgi:hypothetical protein
MRGADEETTSVRIEETKSVRIEEDRSIRAGAASGKADQEDDEGLRDGSSSFVLGQGANFQVG